ncbi:MAG: hypothetical protein E7214_05530 [Clostridium sp.]|nr:hypothetical protein [Clostridium sp.]
MSNISAVSILLCISIFLFFLYQVSVLVRSINKNIKKNRLMNILGVIVTFLLFVFVLASTLSVEIGSSFVITAILILSVIFYIGNALSSLYKIKR